MKQKNDWQLTSDKKEKIIEKLKYEPTFKLALKKDLTDSIHEELTFRSRGEMTSHFIIYIRGCPSITTTGTFKSSLGMEFGILYDKKFSTHNIAFDDEEFVNMIQHNVRIRNPGKEEHTVWVRDESPQSLKRRAAIEFSIMAESLRDSKVSLILIKPIGEPLDLATFILEPFLVTKDMTKVRCAVYNSSYQKYRGYFDAKIHLNNPIWKKYLKLKKEYQKRVITRNTGIFDTEEYAKNFLNNYSADEFIIQTKKGNKKFLQKRITAYLNKEYNQLTNQERTDILEIIKLKLEEKIKN